MKCGIMMRLVTKRRVSRCRRELNQYENEVMNYTGLSIARFAHIRNRVKCEDCEHWFKAVKYLTKDIATECKDNDVMDETPQYGIVCGKCIKSWSRKCSKSLKK